MTYALTLPVPAAAHSLDAYIQTANGYPMLSAEEEGSLARRLRDDGDLDAARGLILSHLRLVVSIARGYLGYGLPHGDLIQEGNIGLMKAVKRFDPDRGVRLVSFAMHWIRAEIHEYVLRNWRLVRIATTKAQRKLFFNLRSLKKSLSSLTQGEAEAMAQQLGVTKQDVLEMETRMAGQDVALEPTMDDGEESYAPIAWLASAEDEPATQLAQAQIETLRSAGLTQALASLDPRSRHIVESRWLGEDGGATLHELAAEYGISAERVRQIEAKAMQKMRALIPA
jgi:RNA polymerase sigma-32 factor